MSAESSAELYSPPTRDATISRDALRREAPEAVPGEARSIPWEMKELKPKHKQICSMLAQGIPRSTIASVIDCTPEYISMLSAQPKMQDYMKEMCQAASLQLEGMFVQSVEVIGEVMRDGNHADKVKAARLQLEATKRVGAGSVVQSEVIDADVRLATLAARLLALKSPNPTIITLENINGTYQEAGSVAPQEAQAG